MKPLTDNPSSGEPGKPAETLAAILGEVSGRPAGARGRRWLIGAVVLALAVAGIWYFGFRGESGFTYATDKATTGNLTVSVTATGSVQPTEQVDVSSELSGTVKTVNVDYNSTVKSGDVLAELVTDTLDANVASARAKLASANAGVAKAHAAIASTSSILANKKVLVGRNVSSSQELIEAQANQDAAIAAEDAAKAEVLVAEANLRLAETNLSKAQILSPIDGMVLTRDVDPGATVAASLSAPVLFTIAGDLREMELQVDVDEADVGEVQVGQQASFTVDAFPERTFPAKIKDIRFVSETVQNVVTYKALLTVDNSELLLRPGMTATADIVVEEVQAATLIPNAALRYSPPATASGGGFALFQAPRMGAITDAEPTGRQRTVWVLKDGVPTAVSIEIGATDGSRTVVRSGAIQPGDQLIVDQTAKAG